MDNQKSTPIPGPGTVNSVNVGKPDPELTLCRSQLLTAMAESSGAEFAFPAASFPNDAAYRSLRRELADSGWTMSLVVDVDDGDYFNITSRV
mgnify:CR=1 FL=1